MKTIFQTLQKVFERDYDKYKGWFLTLKVTLTLTLTPRHLHLIIKKLFNSTKSFL